MPSVKRIGRYGIADEFNYLLKKRKCAKCKETFFTAVPLCEWGFTHKYKGHYKAFCSYHCMMEYEKPLIKKNAKQMAKKFHDANNFEMEEEILASVM